MHKKMGVSIAQQEALEELLRERNPLLANLGKVGRKMAAQLDWEDEEVTFTISSQLSAERKAADLKDRDKGIASAISEERSLADALCSRPMPGEIVKVACQDVTCAHDVPEEISILTCLQADLIHLRNDRQPLPLDSSVQVHAAPNCQREIEALHDTLSEIMQAHSIAPSDVQILAPDIELYVPYIKATFGAEGRLHYHLADLPVFAHDAFSDGFRRLLDLSKSRWEAPTVLQFFECLPVRERYGFSEVDLQQIRDWVQKAGIRWGATPTHRSELLKEAHCSQGPVSNHNAGTWNEGIGRLLHGLVYGSEEIEHPTLPVLSLSWTQAELLNKFIECVYGLQEDLRPLQDGTRRSPSDWATYLKRLCQNYLSGNDERLLHLLDELARISRPIVPFTSVRKRLQRALQSKRYTQRDKEGQAVRFGSIRSSSGIPAKVVCLIGLDESAFPIATASSPLNLLSKSNLADEVPFPIEHDRQRFLDAILSAREHLILSYTGLNIQDGREQNPSTLITELTAYLQRAYEIAPEAITVRHPFYPFDRSQFAAPNLQPHFRHAAAQAYYSPLKHASHSFLINFPPLSEVSSSPSTIDLKDLKTAAKNPLKLYFNHALGIYVREEEALRADESFILNPLDRHHIREEAKERTLEIALQRATAKSMMPPGVFGEVAEMKVKEGFEAILEQIDPEQLFSVEFGLHAKEPIPFGPKKWLLPAIPVHIGLETVSVCGRLHNLSADGLLCNGSGDDEALIKAWPESLLLQYIPDSILPHKAILWTKSAKSSVIHRTPSQLHAFVHYTLTCRNSPSPLLPEWVKAIVSKDRDKIQKSFEGDRFFNEYAKWGCGSMEELFDANSMNYWAEIAADLYGDIMKKES